MSIVGSTSVAKEKKTVSAPPVNDGSPTSGARPDAQADQLARKSVTRMATAAKPSSRRAYVPSGLRTRSASLPPSQLPSDSPKKKLATVMLTANVELPSTNWSCLNQTT